MSRGRSRCQSRWYSDSSSLYCHGTNSVVVLGFHKRCAKTDVTVTYGNFMILGSGGSRRFHDSESVLCGLTAVAAAASVQFTVTGSSALANLKVASYHWHTVTADCSAVTVAVWWQCQCGHYAIPCHCRLVVQTVQW